MVRGDGLAVDVDWSVIVNVDTGLSSQLSSLHSSSSPEPALPSTKVSSNFSSRLLSSADVIRSSNSRFSIPDSSENMKDDKDEVNVCRFHLQQINRDESYLSQSS